MEARKSRHRSHVPSCCHICILEDKLHCWKTIQTLSCSFHAGELGYILKLQSGCLKQMKLFSVSVIMVNKRN